MSIEIGFMQGRLVEKYNGRYQAFHPTLWEDEFKIASSLGLKSIEIIADYENEDLNPIFQNENSLNYLNNISNDTGVKVLSICADYFMKYQLINKSDFGINKKSLDVMKKLVENSAYIGIMNIVIPLVDESSIKDCCENNELIESFNKIMHIFEEFDIEASFELDMPPKDVITFINNIDSNNAKINYDIGNSASLGYSIHEELSAYGHLINDIHLKDRTLNGGPVIFGTGEADFGVLFDYIYKTKFSGPIVMQSYRDDKGISIFKEQLNWVNVRYIRK
jgi:L-ribulose-5-phosphate 3-epimerase